MAWAWSSPARLPQPVRPSYRYCCVDRSWLLPWLMRLFVRPLAERLPERVTPNQLSLAGFAASLLPLVCRGGPIAAAGLWLYLVLDHLDGLQARRTGRSGPLGEYLDHWLDAWNAGLLPLGVSLTWGLAGPALPVLIALAATAFVVTLNEHRVSGVLRLEKYGSIEGVALVSGLYLLSARLNPTLVIGLQVAGGLGCLATTGVVLRRGGGKLLAQAQPVLLVGLAASLWAGAGLPGELAGLLVTASAALACGRILQVRLGGGPLLRDASGPVLTGLGWLATAGRPEAALGVGGGILAWLLLLTAREARRSLAELA